MVSHPPHPRKNRDQPEKSQISEGGVGTWIQDGKGAIKRRLGRWRRCCWYWRRTLCWHCDMPEFFRRNGDPAFAASCAVCIGCTVFLFVRTGRVQGSDDIFLGESARCPPRCWRGDPVHASAGNGARAVSGRCGCGHRGHRHRGRRRDAAVPFGAGAQMEGRASHRRQPAGPRLANALPGGALCRRALRSILTGENHLNVHYPAGRAWVYRILWVCGVMAGLVVLSYLILSNQLLGVGNARWFGLRALYRLRHVRHFCGDDRRRISCMALLSGRTELRRTSAPA